MSGARIWLAQAAAFHAAARGLLKRSKDDPSGIAANPARLCALQAIESYLTAYETWFDCEAERSIRHRHDLGQRSFVARRRLKGAVCAELAELSHTVTYRKCRYVPEIADELADPVALTEIVDVVAAAVKRDIGDHLRIWKQNAVRARPKGSD
jgi:hypothetical protein